MSKKRVILFLRRRYHTGSFSIETSFECMARSFPADSLFELSSFSSSHYSRGIVPRLRAILEARARAGDVNHITGDVHFLALGMPGRRTVLTVHDCGFMSHPNPMVRRLLKWLWLDLPVRHCRYVTAVSQATKGDIVRFTGCDPDKVLVIPTVVSGDFTRVDKVFSESCPRILHIGMAPNKNFARHVEAISGLPCELHIVGRLTEEHVRLLQEHRIRYKAEHSISEADMQRAYAESDILLFASTLEGFGMPILEAQAVGRPVVTSNISSMPEVAGDGACLVDPGSVESIRAGIMKVMHEPDYRATLVEAGFRNASRYTAEAVARQYEALYFRVAEEAGMQCRERRSDFN